MALSLALALVSARLLWKLWARPWAPQARRHMWEKLLGSAQLSWAHLLALARPHAAHPLALPGVVVVRGSVGLVLGQCVGHLRPMSNRRFQSFLLFIVALRWFC